MALHKINVILLVILVILLVILVGKQLGNNNSRTIPPVQTEVSPTYGDSSFSMFELEGGTFNMTIDVLVGIDKVKATNFVNYQFNSKYTKNDLEGVGGMTFSNDSGYLIIWVENLRKTPEDIAYIEHELLHAVIYIMKFSGVKLSDESEEVFTYELSYLTRQLYKHVK